MNEKNNNKISGVLKILSYSLVSGSFFVFILLLRLIFNNDTFFLIASFFLIFLVLLKIILFISIKDDFKNKINLGLIKLTYFFFGAAQFLLALSLLADVIDLRNYISEFFLWASIVTFFIGFPS